MTNTNQRELSPVERMRRIIAGRGDVESDHVNADAILLEVLRSYGEHELCDLFVSLERWYA